MIIKKSSNQLSQLLSAEKESDERKKQFFAKIIHEENRVLQRSMTPPKVIIPRYFF